VKKEISAIHRRTLTAALGLKLAFATSLSATSAAQGQTFTTLYMFNGGTDGSTPMAGLVRDSKGNLYGTTKYGGDTSCTSGGCGTVFKLNPITSKYAVLHRFGGVKDGGLPTAALVRQSSTGTLYGLTPSGGGALFRLDSRNRFTTLHKFGSKKGDGYNPQGGLFLDPLNHSLWGTTHDGGLGLGTIFEINESGKELSLYSFTGQPNGALPQCTLLNVRGVFYGTTLIGGAYNNGTVFSGSGNVVYSFNSSEFQGPYSSLGLGGPADNPVGTTPTGGDFGQGTVYTFDSSGAFRLLYSFKPSGDGKNPGAAVVTDKAGNVYGTTNNGGTSSVGIVYKVDKTGTETVLHNFTGFSDGACPCANLILDSKGNLYGTASTGGNLSCGTTGCGTVFEITP
jgi:uncharacterized repeat protein (TIGR03803 family)